MGPTIATSSASASPFFDVDAGGNKVRGWTIDFFQAKPGADCTDGSLKVSASLALWTNEPVDGKKVASIAADSEIAIVNATPPTIAGQYAATMGAAGVGSILGTVNVTTFHLDASGNVDHMDGMINAGGMDSSGTAVPVQGTFTAPVCH
jgi:hypothetical protein